MGGARVVLATVTNGDAMGATIGGLSSNGTLMVLGATGSIPVPGLPMILGKLSVRGWYSGTSIDSQETLGFCSMTGVRSMNEEYPLEKAEEAYQRMMSGKARFRAVLKIG